MHESSVRILTDFADFATERQMFLSPIHERHNSILFVATCQDSNHKLSA